MTDARTSALREWLRGESLGLLAHRLKRVRDGMLPARRDAPPPTAPERPQAGPQLAAFLDAAAPAPLVAQALGRVGNYFNQELFGAPTTPAWALEVSPAHRPAGYAHYATIQPTFLYELIWNLLLAAALVWIGHHRRVRAPGLFALYVAGYSFGRIGEELLRVDPAQHIFGLRLNLYVASLLCLAALVWFARIQRLRPTSATIRRGGVLLATGGAIALAGCGDITHARMSRRAADSPILTAGPLLGPANASHMYRS